VVGGNLDSEQCPKYNEETEDEYSDSGECFMIAVKVAPL
jgi:hypothetical protein